MLRSSNNEVLLAPDIRDDIPPWLRVPTLRVHPRALADLRAYVEESPSEISGFALANVVDEGWTVEIVQVFVLRQRCTLASTIITPTAVELFLDELLAAGADPGDVHVYWHSHTDGDAHPSATDVETLGEAFPQADWMISLVVNRRGDMRARLWRRGPQSVLLDLSTPWAGVDLNDETRARARDVLLAKLEVGYVLPTLRGFGMAWGPPDLAWRLAEEQP